MIKVWGFITSNEIYANTHDGLILPSEPEWVLHAQTELRKYPHLSAEIGRKGRVWIVMYRNGDVVEYRNKATMQMAWALRGDTR